jgi:hypothetical protein
MGINDTSGIKLRVLLSKQAVEFNNFIKESRHLFKQTFASPASERSIMKNIPISMLDDFKLVFGNAYRFAYRGSSKAGYTRPQSFIHKDMADTFAVYYLPGTRDRKNNTL